jgi:hypothetical protein
MLFNRPSAINFTLSRLRREPLGHLGENCFANVSTVLPSQPLAFALQRETQVQLYSL